MSGIYCYYSRLLTSFQAARESHRCSIAQRHLGIKNLVRAQCPKRMLAEEEVGIQARVRAALGPGGNYLEPA
jgi:hypothetical protein